jgi:DNA polymerase
MGVDFVPVFSSGVAQGDGPAADPVAARAIEKDPPQVVVLPVNLSRGKRDAKATQAKLDQLRARYEADAPHQHFVTAHTNIVFGEGDPCARLMFVGEAPGAEEDKAGRPFVGRSGQLLNKMIIAMGLSREQVYIGNVLKTRPPDNATPTSDEIRLCAPYLFEQIGIIDPEVIVTLGLPATRALLDSVDSMSRLRGRWAEFRAPTGRGIPVMPTYHPAFLLRSYTPENRGKVWSDLQQAMSRLGLASTGQAPG